MTHSFLNNLRLIKHLQHRPQARKAWLLAAKQAWVMAALFLFAGVFLWPLAVDWLCAWLTPPSVEIRLLGIIKNHHANPMRPWLAGVLWLSFAVFALYEVLRAALRALPAVLAADDTNQTADGVTMLNTGTSTHTGIPQIHGNHAGIHSNAGNTMRSSLRYTLEQELGRGAMGVVHRAQDTLLHRTVALKTLAPQLADDTDLRARFLREARAVARLNHRGIVQIYDLLDDLDGCRIAMEFVKGPTLAQLADKKPQGLDDVLRWSQHIADALATAHEHGVIHRDLKPANILMERAAVPRLTDFGLAKFTDGVHSTPAFDKRSEETQIGTVMGSPAYMSPEQAAGKMVDFHTDIYSFGILLYELLTGKTPFTGEGSAVLAAQITQQAPDITTLRPETPPALAALIAQLLEKSPTARPLSMRAVHNALMQLTH